MSREAVLALHLNGLELVKPGLQRGGLGLVGQLGIGHETVGLAVGVEVGVARLDGGLGGSHGVGDALGKDVQGKHGDDDGKTREERRPPVSEHDALTGRGEHVAPRSGRLRDAGVQERQRSLEHDCVSDKHDGEHHNGGGAVAHNVLDKDPRSTGTRDNDCAHVVVTILAHHVGPHDTRNLRDVEEADGKNERGQVLAEHDDERCCQGDAGEGHDDVHDAHDDLRDPLARHGGNRTDDGTHDKGERGGTQADDERSAGTNHHARQDVAALVVGTEGVVCARRLVEHAVHIRVAGRPEDSDNGHEHDEKQQDASDASRDRHVLPATEAHLAGVLLELAGKTLVKNCVGHSYTVLIRGSIRI